MKTAVLRLYRGDAPAEGTPHDPAAAATTEAVAAPRVLPFPTLPAGHRRGADETARAVSPTGAATLRFHTAHRDDALRDGDSLRDEVAADRAATPAPDDAPDVLPLSAILSPPQFRTNAGATPELPTGAVAGRIGGWASTPAGLSDDGPLTRAKALHANRTCKSCGAGGVEPVLLSDGVRDASGEQVPGSGTLVGFHCCRCEREWPVV